MILIEYQHCDWIRKELGDSTQAREELDEVWPIGTLTSAVDGDRAADHQCFMKFLSFPPLPA